MANDGTQLVAEIFITIKKIKIVKFITCLTTCFHLFSPFHHAPSDNPNYFDVDNGLASPVESRSSGIFTFRKRTSSSNKQSPPSTIGKYNNIEGKRRGSLKNLWRSRSNSTSINYPKVSVTPKSKSIITYKCVFVIGNESAKLVQECTNNTYERLPFKAWNLQRIQWSRWCFLRQVEVNIDIKINLSLISNLTCANFAFNSDQKFYSLSHNSSTVVDGSSHARRHSVGTFAGKDKICTTSFIDEAPLEYAPKAPTLFKRTNRGESLILVSFIRRDHHQTISEKNIKSIILIRAEWMEKINFNWRQSNASFFLISILPSKENSAKHVSSHYTWMYFKKNVIPLSTVFRMRSTHSRDIST